MAVGSHNVTATYNGDAAYTPSTGAVAETVNRVTTTVALTVAEQGWPNTWDLTGDLVDAPLQGNPHADRLGHADVWRFEDRAARPASSAPRASPARGIASTTTRSRTRRRTRTRTASPSSRTSTPWPASTRPLARRGSTPKPDEGG